MSDETHGLLVSFTGLEFGDNAEQAYVNGWEMGQIWERMRSGREAEISATVRGSNRAVLERCCVSEGWQAEFTEAKDDADNIYPEWMFVTLRKVASAKQNPRGLRVV